MMQFTVKLLSALVRSGLRRKGSNLLQLFSNDGLLFFLFFDTAYDLGRFSIELSYGRMEGELYRLSCLADSLMRRREIPEPG